MRKHYDFSKMKNKRNPYLGPPDHSEDNEAEDIELLEIAKKRENEESIPVNINDL